MALSGRAHALRSSSVHGAPLSEHVPPPPQRPPLNMPPLFAQSIALMQSIDWPLTTAVVLPAAHAVLQAVNCATIGDPAQVFGRPLMTQFRAAAVNWLASCRTCVPCTFTHSASSAEC